MKNLVKKPSKFRSLKRGMLIHILLVSTLITSVVTGVTLIRDYQEGISEIDSTFKQIENTNLDSLSVAIWSLDSIQINTQIEGILQNPAMVEVQLYNEFLEKTIDIKKDNREFKSKITREFPLKYYGANQSFESIGSLTVTASKDQLHKKLFDTAVYIAASQGLKTLIVSFAILMIFQYHLIGRTNTLIEFFEGITESAPIQELKFKAISNYNDELTELEKNINAVVERLNSHHQKTVTAIMNKDKDLKIKERVTQDLMSDRDELMKAIDDQSSELSEAKRGLLEFSEKIRKMETMNDFTSSIGTKTNSLSVAIHSIQNNNEMYLKSLIGMEGRFKKNVSQGHTPKNPNLILSELMESEIFERTHLSDDLKTLQDDLKTINESLFSLNSPASENISKEIVSIESIIDQAIAYAHEKNPDWYFLNEINCDGHIKVDPHRLVFILNSIFETAAKSYNRDETVQLYISADEVNGKVELSCIEQGNRNNLEDLNASIRNETDENSLYFTATSIYLFQGSLKIQSHQPKGTSIVVTLPFSTSSSPSS